MEILNSDQTPKKKPKLGNKVWWAIGGVAALVILIASQGSSTQPANPTVNFQSTSQSNSSTLSSPNTDTSTNTSSNNSAPSSAPTPSVTEVQPTGCMNGTYVNSDGNTVCSPEVSPTAPSGATAQCVDGTYSFSQHRSGTCSHHGGVAQWL